MPSCFVVDVGRWNMTGGCDTSDCGTAAGIFSYNPHGLLRGCSLTRRFMRFWKQGPIVRRAYINLRHSWCINTWSPLDIRLVYHWSVCIYIYTLLTVDIKIGQTVIPVAASHNACLSTNIRYWCPKEPSPTLQIRACALFGVDLWWRWSQMFNAGPGIGAIDQSIDLHFSKTDPLSLLVVVAHDKVCAAIDPFRLRSTTCWNYGTSGHVTT